MNKSEFQKSPTARQKIPAIPENFPTLHMIRESWGESGDFRMARNPARVLAMAQIIAEATKNRNT